MRQLRHAPGVKRHQKQVFLPVFHGGKGDFALRRRPCQTADAADARREFLADFAGIHVKNIDRVFAARFGVEGDLPAIRRPRDGRVQIAQGFKRPGAFPFD